MIRRGEWDMLVIPAVAPEAQTYKIGPGEDDVYHRPEGEVLLPDREPQAVLDALKIEIGSMNFSAQYMQDPVPPDGNIIKREWLRYYEEEPQPFLRVISSWDLASTIEEKSSYSVGMLWGEYDDDFYILDMVRRKLETPELRKLIIEYEGKWDPNVSIIESTELGRSLCQDLRQTTKIRPKLITTRIDKEARLLTQAARFEGGRVLLPVAVPWLDDYEEELLAFPYGRNDDQVDATSQALYFLTTRTNAKAGTVRARVFG